MKIDKLRLKAKKVINAEGEHRTTFGDGHRKYWFSRSNIKEILNRDVNHTQYARLGQQDIYDFENEAQAALEFFGYERAFSTGKTG